MESKFIVEFLPSNFYSARRVIAIAVSYVGRTRLGLYLLNPGAIVQPPALREGVNRIH